MLLSVDDFEFVEVLGGFDELVDVALGFQFREALPPSDELVQGLVLAELQHDVDVLLVLEVFLEQHHLIVAQRLVDLYLGSQLHTNITCKRYLLPSFCSR